MSMNTQALILFSGRVVHIYDDDEDEDEDEDEYYCSMMMVTVMMSTLQQFLLVRTVLL